MEKFFNGNAIVSDNFHTPLDVSDFLNDIETVFNKHGIKSIQMANDSEPYAFQLGYSKEEFGLNGSKLFLKQKEE